jgi:hypothetical protein
MLDATDDHQINQKIDEYIKHAKVMREKVKQNVDDRHLKCGSLSDVMAVFLLASEPESRRSKLQRLCTRQGVSLQSNTTLLLLALQVATA